MTLAIDTAGRVVIPKSMRDQIGLSAGSEMEIHLKDGRLELEPVSTKCGWSAEVATC